jgi:PQQ-dependent dehydrogenase (methanol/ethanol family)
VASLLIGALAIACDGGTRVGAAAAGDRYPTTAAADSAQHAAMADTAGWAAYGRDYSNQRYSRLNQIDTTNVGDLAPAWINHSGLAYASESNPVVVDGVMYLSTALNHVLALDAVTGTKRWEYRHQYRTTVDCCAAVNRGVAVYGGRVFMGTVDARLVALDARDGHLLWDVSVGDNNLGYHITGAPTVVGGRVITGVSGGEQGGRCYVDAYDAATGARLWRWYTIPSPAEGGWWGTWREHDEWGQSFARNIAQEKHDSAEYADAWQHGGGPMWHHPAYDPASGLLFMNIGNPAPDVDGGVRPGDNLYTNSIVAVEAATGKLRWYYQEISHDLWDYDATSPAVLVEVPDSAGHMIKAVAEAGKDGFVYVLDRATGKPIRKSDAFVPLENYMKVPTREGLIIAPGALGGSDWSPAAFNPSTGYLYVDGNYLPMKYKLKREELRPPAQYWGGTVVATPGGHYGLFSAVDLATGRIAWQTRTDAPLISGAVATAGGLVFTGTSDKHFIALNARTGRQLWSYEARAAINAPPITYAIGGRQYVAVAATGLQTLNSPRGDALLVFALPPARSASR